MKNVLSDMHHSDLFFSLQLLFEKRLGWNLYRQIGIEWFKEGYWKLNDLEETAKQYLEEKSIPNDGTLPLNDPITPSIFKDEHNGTTNKGITFEQFKQMPIDIVVASIPAHIEPFKKLAQMKGAKFIFQAGNVFPEVQYNLLPNLMTNTLPPNPPTHTVSYHQEFSLDIFKPSSEAPERLITSFINVYQHNAGFEDYLLLKTFLPEYDFKSYGGQCYDGSVPTTQEVAGLMKKSAWGFHSKRMGDGYGHVLYNWFAVGRPVITRISDYKGKLGEELLTDGETCIDLDKHEMNEVAEMIQNMPPHEYEFMCQKVRERFEEKVNFDKEEVKLREFLDNLV